MAIRLVVKLNNILQFQLRVKDVFELRSVIKLIEGAYTNNNHTKEKYKPFRLIEKENYTTLLRSTNLIEDIYPASYLQMGMLLESDLDNTGMYHDIFKYTIKAKFDKKKFLTIWEQLIKRHDLLRASFVFSNDGCAAVIYKNIDVNSHIYIKEDVTDLIFYEKCNNFDYNNPGLFRLIINDVGSKFNLILSFHHAIADGWSIASLMNEFIQSYVNDKKTQEKLNLRYGEFVENELLAIKKKSHILFWKKYLNNFHTTRINCNFNSKQLKDHLCSSSFQLNKIESMLIFKLAKDLKISVDSIFLLIYLKILSFFVSKTDITIGIVVNNRLEKTGGDELFGLFLNTIPFRFKFNDKKNVIDEFTKVFKEKIKLQKHKEMPYGHIKSLFAQKDIYDFVFNYVHFHVFNESKTDVENSDGYEKTNIPVILNVIQQSDATFFCNFQANTNYFNQGFLDYFTDYYKKYLPLILKKPSTQIQLIKKDYEQIIKKWNDTDKEYPRDKIISELFEEQVLRNPDRVAIVYEDKQLTYRELNERSNQLAHYLRKRCSIRADSLVALCLDRSEEMK